MQRPDGPRKSSSGGWWLAAGIAGAVVVARNPIILEWAVKLLAGLNAYSDARARQLLEAQQPPGQLPSPPQPKPDLRQIPYLELLPMPRLESMPPPSLVRYLAQSPPEYIPPVDQPLSQLVHHPAVVLILGHRGSGKTALAIRLQELLRDAAAPYAVGLPPKARDLLPQWYGLAPDFDTIPQNSVIYVPESYRFFHARDTSSARGRMVAQLVNLSRHRRQTLIFDVQNAAQLDRNIISEVDLVLVKEPGPFQQGFERTQFQELLDQARAAFEALGKGRRKQSVWVVAPAGGVMGQLMQNQLPSFWSDSLSRIFGDASVSAVGGNEERSFQGIGHGAAELRPGKRTPAGVKREKARQMRASGYSYGEIASALGCSKSYAYKLVNGSG